MTEADRAVCVRRAKAQDMTAVRGMIQELADFEKMSSGPEISVQDLIRDAGLDGGRELFHCYIIERKDTKTVEPSCLWFPFHGRKSRRFLGEMHDGVSGGHLVINKTLEKAYEKTTKAMELVQNLCIHHKGHTVLIITSDTNLHFVMNESTKSLRIRRAVAQDMTEVRIMIEDLADFGTTSSRPELSVQDLIRDAGLDGGRELFHCYIIERMDTKTPNPNSSWEPIGYAICFFTYSTWQGKSYFLEDLYIKPAFRKQGFGGKLFRHVAKNAREFGCKRLDFHVLGWNPATKFYKELGADDFTSFEDWHYFRLHGNALQELKEE